MTTIYIWSAEGVWESDLKTRSNTLTLLQNHIGSAHDQQSVWTVCASKYTRTECTKFKMNSKKKLNKGASTALWQTLQLVRCLGRVKLTRKYNKMVQLVDIQGSILQLVMQVGQLQTVQSILMDHHTYQGWAQHSLWEAKHRQVRNRPLTYYNNVS